MLITETNANNLKQGDKSTLSYICLTDSDLTGQSAKAVLKTRQNAVVYTTESSVQEGNVVEFTIDKVLPVNRYIVEIVVNEEYIFPDDNTIYLNVTASSMGAVVDSLETNSMEMVKEYIKSILDDISSSFTKNKADQLYQPKGEYVGKDDLNAYATKEYVDSLDVTDQLGDYATKEDIANLVTENKMIMYVGSQFIDIDRKGYVKKDYVDEQIEKLSQSLKEDSVSEEPAFVPDLTGLTPFGEKEGAIKMLLNSGSGAITFNLGNTMYSRYNFKPKYILKNGKYLDISNNIDFARDQGRDLELQFKNLDESQVAFLIEGTNYEESDTGTFIVREPSGLILYAKA